MKHTRNRKVGKKKFNKLVNEEVNKIEQHRPPRVKRNGRELNTETQNKYIQEKEEASLRKRNIIKLTNKAGNIQTSYFDTPCIYFLYKSDTLVYIGQTLSLARRIKEHIESDKDFDSFIVHTFIEDEYTRLKSEQILIRKHRPKLNKVHK